MRIDLTSFFLNTSIKNATATVAWSTSVGQKKSNKYKIDKERRGVVDLLVGMNYKINSDIKNLDISSMSKNRELLYFSIFDKIYVNGLEIEDASFILLFVKEHSEHHNGRLAISYPQYAKYLDTENNIEINNLKTIKKIAKALNSEDGSWFVYEITCKNQDELHFKAIVVDANSSKIYDTSDERREEWNSLVQKFGDKEFEIPNSSLITQKIFYGAPGTGKSHKVKELVSGKEDRTERVTFHPDYDYNSFVGGYKPTMEGSEIRYQFVPQAFTKIYVDSWNDLENDYYLIIEEINRGNCAEIFGDIFQLLDRTNDYHITPSKELKEYLNSQFFDNEMIDGDKLILPKNLNILATMNTSDQSLYPMDSAFKRRWDWEYIPINDSFSEENQSSKFIVKLSEKESFSWLSFILLVNTLIKNNENLGMDKCLGNYFIKPLNNIIDIETFINKAIFYLWNDVFKDEIESNSIFINRTTYEDFFPIQINGIKKVKEILEILKVDILVE